MIIETHIEDLIFNYFTGNLSEEEKQELVEWLHKDEKNKVLFSEMSDWWAIAHTPLFSHDKKKNFNELFNKDFIEEQPVISQKKKFNWNLVVKIAASVLLLVAFSGVAYYTGTKKDKTEESAAYETIVPLGSVSQVILPDSSIIWLNAGSSIKYTNQYNKKNRTVSLQGEAYFEVTGDSLKPFIVKTEHLNIQVKGTRFNVKAYEEDPILNVELLQGKVDIQVEQEFKDTEKFTLKPNNSFAYNKENHEIAIVEDSKISRSIFWKDGIITFDNVPFTKIATDLERKFNIQIDIKSAKLKKESFSGSFSKHASLDKIMGEVDVDHKYAWFQKDHYFIIKDK